MLQANQTGNSNAMELEGAKGCFDFLLTVAGLTIQVFISDRHRGITKWIRESHPAIQHFFDQWHIAKGIVKKMLAASKEKGCEQIGEWTKAVRNHVYWCSTSTVKGFGNMILAKWKSFMRHVANKHDHHPDNLFPKCAHDELESQRKWIKVGMGTTKLCLLYTEGEREHYCIACKMSVTPPPPPPPISQSARRRQ